MLGESEYRRDIQALRGLAVLAVVLFHANEYYFPLGYLGVDVFFVISGFVVTPLILRIFTNQTNGLGLLPNLRHFYKRRFYRLAPALVVTLAISAIAIFFLGPFADHQRIGRQAIATLLLAGNVGAYKYSGDYFSPNPNPLVHTWSLSVEEQIYLFLPLILLLILRKLTSVRNVTVVVLALISTISLISFTFPTILQPLYSLLGIQTASQFSFYSPIDRIWQFGLGGLGILLLNRYQFHMKKFAKIFNIASTISLAIILFAPVGMDIKFSSILVSLFSLIVISSKSLEVLPDSLIKKLEWVGDRSYSIYLVHMPLIYLAQYSPVLQNGSTENRVIQSMIAVMASISLGSLSYSKIENRYRISQITPQTSPARLKVTSSILTFSLLFSFFIVKGTENDYWGLHQKIAQPPVAWNADRNCVRMSEVNDPPCMYKLPDANKTVLLIGDSRAAQFSEALIVASEKAKWNSVVWTMASCFFILSDESEEISKDCLKRNNLILSWINTHRPNLVIVSQYNKFEFPQAGMKSALVKLNNLTLNLLVIGNTPMFPDQRYMASPAIFQTLFQSEYEAPKRVLVSKMDTSNVQVSKDFLNLITNEGIEIVDLNSLWCNTEYCNRFGSEGWLFFDTGHLSEFGAEMSVPYFTKVLNEN